MQSVGVGTDVKRGCQTLLELSHISIGYSGIVNLTESGMASGRNHVVTYSITASLIDCQLSDYHCFQSIKTQEDKSAIPVLT